MAAADGEETSAPKQAETGEDKGQKFLRLYGDGTDLLIEEEEYRAIVGNFTGM